MNARELLQAIPDAGPMTLHAGQVLVYPRHTPPGLFVVLAGVLRRFAEGTVPEAGCGDLLDAASGAFAVPAPDEIGRPAGSGVAAQTDVELLFVPRSVVLEGAAVAKLLGAAGIACVPLRDGAKGRDETATRRGAR
jgi:CRP-like cAMP-binding protein